MDDPADGKASAIDPEKYIITDPTTYKTSSDGSDTEPYDYKKVKITVSTDDRHDRILATIISDVASAVAETLNETGALEICLSDSDGQVVKDGKVLIELEENENYHSQGALHIERTVDDETGCIFQPNLEVIVNEADPGNPVPDSNLYRILGFYGPDDTSYSSTYRYVNVITQQLSRYSLTIGQWKELTINAKYLDGTPVISPSIEIFGSDGLLRSKSGDVNGKATFTKSDQLPPIQYFFYRSTINSGSEYIYPVYFSVPEFWDLNVWKKFNEDRGSTDYTNLELDGYFTSDPSLPQHLEISPNMVVQQNDVYVRVSGRNLSDDSIVKLISESGVEINAGYDSPKYVTNDPPDGYDYVECVFNLSGADTGKYDVVISNLGKSVTIPDYFEITI